MADGGGDDILSRKKEFLESFFKKGAEFTEEILRENEKLRFRALELEEQLAAASRAISTPVTVQELQDRVVALERERRELTEKFKRVEAENRAYLERSARIEHENHNLANLYVAAYQLHSTFDLREVLQQVVEILLNFVGAKRFAVLLWDDEAGRLRPVATEGLARADVAPRALGAGVIGQVAASGAAHYGPVAAARAGQDDPAVCVPLRMKSKIVGAIAIWEFLQQKTELLDVDYELFDLLGAHAASALEAARLVGESSAPPLRFAALESLL